MKELWSLCDPSVLNSTTSSSNKPAPETKKEGKESAKEDSKAPPNAKGGQALGIITMSLSPNVIHISDDFNDPWLLMHELQHQFMPNQKSRLTARTCELTSIHLKTDALPCLKEFAKPFSSKAYPQTTRPSPPACPTTQAATAFKACFINMSPNYMPGK